MGFYPKMEFFDLEILSPIGHTFAIPQKEMEGRGR